MTELPQPPRNASEVLAATLPDVPRILLRDLGSEHLETPVVKLPTRSRQAEPPLPQHIGPFQISGEIAHGGVGIVFKARDLDLGRDVAIKILHARHRDNPDLVRRFVEEAQIGSQLQHPGIVPVHGMGVLPDGLPYLAMKLVKGRTLASILENRRDPGDDRLRLLGIFERLCQTLAYAHARRVVHRDLKPSNVMVGAFGEVQLMDWGLAKVLSRPDIQTPRENPSLPQSIITTVRSVDSSSQSLAGSIFGTPAYMAPEQARGQVELVDERSDVFGLGALLCEILTGEPPYTGESREKIHEKARKGYLDEAFQRLDACGAPELGALTRRALAFEPRHRPASASNLAQEIKAHLDSSEERRRQLSIEAAAARARLVAERRSRQLLLGFLAAAAILLLCAGWAWRTYQREGAATQALALKATRESIATAQQLFGAARAAQLELDVTWEALQGRWQQAVEAAMEAESRSLLGAPEATQGEASELRLQLQAEARTAREAALRRERNRRLLARLEEIRLEGYAHLDPWRANAEYRAAFEDLGIDVEGLAVEPAALALEETGIAGELAESIARWALVKTNAFGARSPGAPRLRSLSDRMDPDPQRQRIRRAVAGELKRELQVLAAQARGKKLAASTLALLAEALLAVGFKPPASVLLDEAIELEPDRASLHFLQNRVSMSSRGTLILESWIPALALRPGSADLIGWLGRGRNSMTWSQQWLQEAIRLQPRDPLLLAALGQNQLELGHHSAAAGWMVASLRLDPFQLPAWHNYAMALGSMGQRDEAGRTYERALREDRAGVTLNNLGYHRKELGDLDGALAAWTEAISRYTGDPGRQAGLHLEISTLLLQKGDLDGAASRTIRAQLLDPADGVCWLKLAAIRERQGHLFDALAQIQIGLEKRITDDNALASACSTVESVQLPRPSSQQASTLDALADTISRGINAGRLNHPRWRAALLRVHAARLERLPEASAMSQAREIAARFREIPELHALEGILAWQSGARSRAIDVLEEAVQAAAVDSPLRQRLGDFRRALEPDLVTFDSIDAALDGPRLHLGKGDVWRYFRGTRTPSPGLEWTAAAFDDSGWEEGPSGFGYADGDDNTILDDMLGKYRALYIRRTLDLPALQPGDRIEMRVLADDGFIAHVNGRRAGSFRVSGSGEEISLETMMVDDHEATEADVLDITELCQRGVNHLAILGLNKNLGSSDFTLAPEVLLWPAAGSEGDQKLLEGLRAVASGDDAPARLAYLEGRVHERAGRSAEAIAALERALSLAPGAGLPLERLLAARDAAGSQTEALASIELAFAAGGRATSALLDRWVTGKLAAGVSWADLLEAWPRRADVYDLVLSPRSSSAQGVAWRYTTLQPAGGWKSSSFPDLEWNEAPGPFGLSTRPEAIVPRTAWTARDIWLRRGFSFPLPVTLPAGLRAALVVHLAQDDAAEVYLNGVELTRRASSSWRYGRVVLPDLRALKQGENCLAVHCHNPQGGGLIDVELVLRISTSER